MRKKVMIIEDDKETVEVIDKFLTSSGYITIPVSDNFQNSLEIAKKSKPDLVLMDIQLVGVSGTDLIEEFKLNPYLASTPIVAITALTNESSKRKIMNQAECDAYIAKPFKKSELLKIIESYI